MLESDLAADVIISPHALWHYEVELFVASDLALLLPARRHAYIPCLVCRLSLGMMLRSSLRSCRATIVRTRSHVLGCKLWVGILQMIEDMD